MRVVLRSRTCKLETAGFGRENARECSAKRRTIQLLLWEHTFFPPPLPAHASKIMQTLLNNMEFGQK